MTASVTDNLPLLARAPNGIKKLRELILELAVRGKLTPQDPRDEPASKLLERIREAKARLVAEGRLKKQKPMAEVAGTPSGLPENWIWCSLAEVALVNPRNSAADSLDVSFVPMTLIGTRFDSLHDQEQRVWSEVKQGFTHFAEADIGVAKITPCFENSKACVFSNLTNGLGAGTTELHIVRPIRGTLDPRYVLAYLKSPQFLAVGETKMTGTAGQKRLPKNFVEENPFPLPPLAEQHRIVAKVDELMAICDTLESQEADAESAHARLVQALLDSLTQANDAKDFAASWQRLSEHFHSLFTTESSIDALKQTLLQLAVMGKLTNQDPSDEPASKLIGRIAKQRNRSTASGSARTSARLPELIDEEKLFELPKGWAWQRFGNYALDISTGPFGSLVHQSDYVDGGVPLINPSHMIEGRIVHDPSVSLPRSMARELSSYALREGDMVMARRGEVGRAALVTKIEDGWLCGTGSFVLRFVPEVSRPYIWILFKCSFVRKYLAGAAIGMTMVNLNHAVLLKMPIAIPPLAEQHRIVTKVDQLMSLCDQLRSRLNRARQVNERLADTLIECAAA